jgi:hypothetical protein
MAKQTPKMLRGLRFVVSTSRSWIQDMLWQLKDSEQRLLALAKQVLWCEVVTDLSERFQDDLYDNQHLQFSKIMNHLR